MNPSLFVALPIYGNVSPHFLNSLLRLQAQPPCELQIGEEIGSELHEARNTLIMRGLESGAKKILFIDHDMLFSPRQVAKIYASEKDIVGGIYCKRRDVPELDMTHSPAAPATVVGDLVECEYLATGFMCIKREVIEELIKFYGEKLWYSQKHAEKPERHYQFFAGSIHELPGGDRTLLSEDWHFCKLARSIGFRVWADTSVLVKHIGEAIYPTQSQRQQYFTKQAPMTEAQRQDK